MSTIIAGRYPTFEQAQRAQSLLADRGFAEQDVCIFYVNPPGRHDQTAIGGDQFADPGTRRSTRGVIVGAVVGAIVGVVFGAAGAAASTSMQALIFLVATGIGAYAGSLIGALETTTHKPAEGADAPHQRPAGVLLAARTDGDGTVASAIAAFELSKALDIEHADGDWRNGQWVDFNPVAPMHLEPDSPRHHNVTGRLGADAHAVGVRS